MIVKYNMTKGLFCLLMVGTVPTIHFTVQAADRGSLQTVQVTAKAAEENVQTEVLQIINDVERLCTSAGTLVDIILCDRAQARTLPKASLDDVVFGNAAKRLVGLEGVCTGLNNQVNKLKSLKTIIQDDEQLVKALDMVESLAHELQESLTRLYNSLKPFRKNKDTKNLPGKVAKILINQLGSFCTTGRINKFKQTLDTVVQIVSQKSDYQILAQKLQQFKQTIEKVYSSSVSAELTPVEKKKIFANIIVMITRN